MRIKEQAKSLQEFTFPAIMQHGQKHVGMAHVEGKKFCSVEIVSFIQLPLFYSIRKTRVTASYYF